MKKIGILFGQENTFPWAFIERINEKKIPGVIAEAVSIDKVIQGDASDYAVIVDRISQDVPFYRAFLKNAAISGTAVINNPFWWSADEKFFNNALAVKIGVPVPNTVILPSKLMPDDTSANSFRNLKYPLDWEGIFKYIGFPAYMKPHDGGGWKSVYKIHNMEDFFDKYAETGQLVMMLQSEVIFEQYYRCYCLGGKYVHIMPYEPRNPHHLRYEATIPSSPELLATVEKYVLMLNQALGYDFNTVEFGVVDGIPYAIDFCNPAPDAELTSVGKENFDWIVENAANYAIERALAHKDGQDNLTWGTYIKYSTGHGNMIPNISAASSSSVVEKTDYKVVKTTTTVNPTSPMATSVTTRTTTVVNPVSIQSAPTSAVVKTVTTAPAEKVKAAKVEKVKVEKPVKAAKVEKVKVEKPVKAAKVKKVKVEKPVKAAKVEKVKVEKPVKAVKVEKVKAEKPVKTVKVEKVKVEKPVKAAKVEKVKVGKPVEVVRSTQVVKPTAKGTPVLAAKKAADTEGGTKADDLKRIEGIGPKIEEILNAAGIKTFKKLATTPAETVKGMLEGAGKRFQMHDPKTWSKQAKLAADGKWEELEKLQDELKGGK
jgi:predicted flap endonuclease-1-like 5' DNA nuclease